MTRTSTTNCVVEQVPTATAQSWIKPPNRQDVKVTCSSGSLKTIRVFGLSAKPHGIRHESNQVNEWGPNGSIQDERTHHVNSRIVTSMNNTGVKIAVTAIVTCGSHLMQWPCYGKIQHKEYTQETELFLLQVRHLHSSIPDTKDASWNFSVCTTRAECLDRYFAFSLLYVLLQATSLATSVWKTKQNDFQVEN